MLVKRMNHNWHLSYKRWQLFITTILVLLPVLLVAASHKHVKHKHWSKKYDHYFKKYSKHYFGVNFSWYWFKAQAITESGLNPKAKSKAGALGIMQILPSTYREIAKKNPSLGGISHPHWNIAAGIYYDRQLYKKWQKRNIPKSELLSFTFASYNAGFSKTLRAFNKANKKHRQRQDKWQQIKKYMPGATRAYVHRIKTLMAPVQKKYL